MQKILFCGKSFSFFTDCVIAQGFDDWALLMPQFVNKILNDINQE